MLYQSFLYNDTHFDIFVSIVKATSTPNIKLHTSSPNTKRRYQVLDNNWLEMLEWDTIGYSKLDFLHIQSDTKKTGTFEKPNKNWRNPRKIIIDRNRTITTCLLKDSNPNYQCLKITSCRWRPLPRMHYFKSSHSFVSPCVCCMLYRMRLRRILQSMQHTQSDTKERELLKCVVAVKECIRGGGRHLQDVIFKHW